MTDNMVCPDCHLLFTYDSSIGGLACKKCGRPRIAEQVAGEPVRQPEQSSSARVESEKFETASGGSTPLPRVETGGESDIRTLGA